MSLDDIRDAARLDVHREFALPAVISTTAGLSKSISARLHIAGQRPFGDLDREGFAQVIETDNVVIIDTAEWTPKRNHVIDFDRGRVFKLDASLSRPGDRFVAYKVTEVVEDEC